jgi:hypothetical protein
MSHKPNVIITDDVARPSKPFKRVMVTGSRTWAKCPHKPEHASHLPCQIVMEHRRITLQALAEHVAPLARDFHVELIHGDAVGADKLVADYWSFYGFGPITAFPYIKELGKGGGHARNGVLVAHMPDLVLAFHLSNSSGTADAIRQAKAAGLTVEVYPR